MVIILIIIITIVIIIMNLKFGVTNTYNIILNVLK